jgi:hypothetical protein
MLTMISEQNAMLMRERQSRHRQEEEKKRTDETPNAAEGASIIGGLYHPYIPNSKREQNR